jgi:hypothetical protein
VQWLAWLATAFNRRSHTLLVPGEQKSPRHRNPSSASQK